MLKGLVESHKCASPSENSVTAPPTKQVWQLPLDWHKNSTLSKSSLSHQSMGVTHKKPTYEISTPASVKKIALIFLSQEQTQILKLVQDGNRHWQCWYTIHYVLKTVLKKWLHRYWKVCSFARNYKNFEKAAYSIAITTSTSEIVFQVLTWLFDCMIYILFLSK